MERKIIVNSNCYHGYSLEDAVEGIASAGFQYIELTATKGWTEHVFYDHSFERLLEVKALLKKKGLTPIAMSGHTSLMDETRIEDFIKNIHLANFFGCEYIVTSVGEAHLEDVDNSGNDAILKQLKIFEPILKEKNMKMVIEVHGHDHGTAAILKDLIAPLHSDVIFIAYDSANAVFYGDVDPVEDLKKAVDVVKYVHLKDKKGEKDVWDFPALGEGNLDLAGIIQVLDEAHNDAPLSIEIEFTEKGPKDLEEINQAVRTSKTYLEKLGLKVGS